jgi:hypothetical protein
MEMNGRWARFAGIICIFLAVMAVISGIRLFLLPKLPETAVEQFDYLYSDDPDDNSAYTLAEFAGILELGRAKDSFQIGDRIKMVVPRNDTFTDTVFVLMVADFNHFPLADGTGFAGVVFSMVGVMNQMSWMNPSHTTTGGWAASELRGKLNGGYYTAFPRRWQALIREVTVLSTIGDNSAEVEGCVDRLFLLSNAEIGQNTGAPYSYEIDGGAENKMMPAYPDLQSRYKKALNGEGDNNCKYWTRSPEFEDKTCFKYGPGQIPSYGNFAGSSFYVSFAFCMGVAGV